jgi:hypothetical protein
MQPFARCPRLLKHFAIALWEVKGIARQNPPRQFDVPAVLDKVKRRTRTFDLKSIESSTPPGQIRYASQPCRVDPR